MLKNAKVFNPHREALSTVVKMLLGKDAYIPSVYVHVLALLLIPAFVLKHTRETVVDDTRTGVLTTGLGDLN